MSITRAESEAYVFDDSGNLIGLKDPLLRDAPPWRFHLTECGEWTQANHPERLVEISERDALSYGYIDFTHEGLREFRTRLAEEEAWFAALTKETP
jgi:hypothetical protein